MGRAGGGSHSSGGGSFGGGHRSGGSISGGHHVSSGGGHRAGSGFSSGNRPSRPPGSNSIGHSSGRPSGNSGFGMPPRTNPTPPVMPRRTSGGNMGPLFSPPPPPPPPRPPRTSYTYIDPAPPPVHDRRRYGCFISTLIALVAMLALVMLFSAFAGSNSGISNSTIVRTKLDDSHAYRTGNIKDDLGWFDSVNSTEKSLKKFYEETGIQPYVYLKAYDDTLSTDEEKESWAKNYFDTELNDSDGFLFIYFAEEDTDNDVGFMSYVTGSRAQSVMDTEAVNIFWGYIDRYWPTDLSTDDVIIKSFNSTANAVMHVSTTGNDIVKYIVIAVIVIGGGILILHIGNTRRQHEKERAEETERILNTPLEKVKDSTDDLIDKYK